MDKLNWLEKVKENQSVLAEFLGAYHPRASYRPASIGKITAPAAEKACEAIRKSIVKNTPVEEIGLTPVILFQKAVEQGDCGKIYSLLNSAWFGVPESTSCWRIRGFKEAVALLEDPVE